jgi:hypothetical protein
MGGSQKVHPFLPSIESNSQTSSAIQTPTPLHPENNLKTKQNKKSF